MIAQIPKWMKRTPGYKNIVTNSVINLENRVPVFLDWEGEITKSNDIQTLPTIIVVFKGRDGRLYERTRVYGKYSDEKFETLLAVTKKSGNKVPDV